MPTPQQQTDHPSIQADAPEPLAHLLRELAESTDDGLVAEGAARLLRDGAESGDRGR
jgi:hypothetical protein